MFGIGEKIRRCRTCGWRPAALFYFDPVRRRWNTQCRPCKNAEKRAKRLGEVRSQRVRM